MLAAEGADIIAVDVCAEVTPVEYPTATPEDLAETVRQVEALDRRIVARRADVRDSPALAAAAQDGAAELGGIDVVVVNAGVLSWSRLWEMPDQQWQEVIDVNLTGPFYTLKATVPIMIDQGRGGATVITSSAAGIKALPGQGHYGATKHGLVGPMQTAAIELAPYNIRVNTVHPWAVDTAGRRDRVPRAVLRGVAGLREQLPPAAERSADPQRAGHVRGGPVPRRALGARGHGHAAHVGSGNTTV